MSRKNFATGAAWESKVGYSRAVRKGNSIEVSGTIGIKDGSVDGLNDPYQQSTRALEIIKESIEQLGGQLSDVVRTRIYVTNIDHWAAVGRAHQKFFKDIMPATSLVEISRLISPEYLVEIEASAIVE